MKPFIASLLTLSLLALSCNFLVPTAPPPPTTSPAPPTSSPLSPPPPTATHPPSNLPNILDTPWDDLSIFKDGLAPSAQPVLEELRGASVYHLQLNIADDLFNVTGMEEVKYTNNEDVPLTEIHFRLFPNILGGGMKVSNLRVDDAPVKPRYGLRNSLMIVPLAEALSPGESVIIHMDFSVVVPQSVDLNYGVLAYADDVLALAHAYPMVAVYNDEGWNAEIPPQSGDVAFADMSFYLVRVTAPKGVTVITSGRAIGADEAGQVQIQNVASGPARDFYLAASPAYEETSQTFGEVTIRSYAPQYLSEGSQAAVEIASQAVEDFSARYAPYPYTELKIVATPTLALGIEYPGMIAITSWVYEAGKNDPYFEGTVAHEVGHQWFYNLVGDDQLDDPWLDESLTQFITLQYYSDEHGATGEEEFRSSLEGRWAYIDNETIPIGLPVAEYTDFEYSAIVYGRGPLFFVALKEKMGDAAFDAFMREYTQSLAWKISTAESLQALAEKNCACELDALFDEWVYP
ncbi:MAG: M1 family metallopeptidase [Anaerolineales bacterium]|nr:M1 family metallopeptidase [Anaerolineales bacterium]